MFFEGAGRFNRSQYAPKMRPRRPKVAPGQAKMAPRRALHGQRCVQDALKTRSDAPKILKNANEHVDMYKNIQKTKEIQGILPRKNSFQFVFFV